MLKTPRTLDALGLEFYDKNEKCFKFLTNKNFVEKHFSQSYVINKLISIITSGQCSGCFHHKDIQNFLAGFKRKNSFSNRATFIEDTLSISLVRSCEYSILGTDDIDAFMRYLNCISILFAFDYKLTAQRLLLTFFQALNKHAFAYRLHASEYCKKDILIAYAPLFDYLVQLAEEHHSTHITCREIDVTFQSILELIDTGNFRDDTPKNTPQDFSASLLPKEIVSIYSQVQNIFIELD